MKFIYGEVYFSNELGCRVEIVERDHNGAYNDVKVRILDGQRSPKMYHLCDNLKHICMWHENS